MTDKTRVLFVDDEQMLRDMWSAILSGEGFEVTTCATVSEALSRITSEKFDALVADLNIGEAGDGFTIVSAMRRVQPQAVTLILTGYPAFQAALRAIHEQVDDFLVKPAEPKSVAEVIRQNLLRQRKHAPVLTERLNHVIEKHREDILESWYKAVESHPEIRKIPLPREERIDDLPRVLDGLVRPMDDWEKVRAGRRSAAYRHGEKRRQQGYTSDLLLEETRILHRVIADCMQQNLLQIDISNVIPDLVEVHDRIQRTLQLSLDAFLRAGVKTAA
ncbi:MAG TPA: response regulator [Candidatus Eisenbacteria bacterium]|nr:response regulator [Candidatus Eisenbacteria bacterium]